MDYQPVCGAGMQYYNPCFAGCRARDPTGFTNCSCVAGDSDGDGARPAETARAGPCTAACPLFPLFLASLFLTIFVTFLANMPSLTATLRCVDPSARSLALGIQVAGRDRTSGIWLQWYQAQRAGQSTPGYNQILTLIG
jgi:hypothetical protein